jgi:hypothetical protein
MFRYRSLEMLPLARQLFIVWPKKRPLEIRKHHTVSVDRSVKLQACMAYTVGEVAKSPCDTCAKGYGVFPKCVIVDGFFKGACTTCHYRSHASSVLSELASLNTKSCFERQHKFFRQGVDSKCRGHFGGRMVRERKRGSQGHGMESTEGRAS